MTEKTKTEQDSEENCESDNNSAWSQDQQENSYYYDDAYGYKVYNPDDVEEEEED